MSNYNSNQQPQDPYYQHQYPQEQQPFPAPAFVQYVQADGSGSGSAQHQQQQLPVVTQQQYYYVEQQPQSQGQPQVYYDYTGQQPMAAAPVVAQMPMPMPMPFPQSPLPHQQQQQQQQQQHLQMPQPAVMPTPTPMSPVPAVIPQPTPSPGAATQPPTDIAAPLANQASGDGSAVVAFAPSKFDSDDQEGATGVSFKPSAFDPSEISTPVAAPPIQPAPVSSAAPPQQQQPAAAPKQDTEVTAPPPALPVGSLAPDRPWYLQKKWQISLSTFACSFIVALCSILGHTRFIQAVNDKEFPAPVATQQITAKSVVFLDLIGVLASVISLTVVARFSMVRPGTIIPLLFHRAVAILSGAMTLLLMIATTLLFVRMGSDTGGAYAAVCDPTPLGGLFPVTADRFATACSSWRACIFFGYVGTAAWLALAVKSYTKWVSMRVEKK